MTGNAPTHSKLLLQVFLPFAFAYFLSYIFRGVNAVIFPYLERDIGITAADLGLLTSAFFLFFALIQPLQGVALDRYGPRKVQTVLLIVAALGSALFGFCTSLPELVVARVLIGIGFAGGLMSAIKVFTLWYPPRQWGLVTGFHMMAGGAGSMAATLAGPVVALDDELAGPVLLAGRHLPRDGRAALRRRARKARDRPHRQPARSVPRHRHRADRRLLLAHPAAARGPAARLHRLHQPVDRAVAARRRRHRRHRPARRHPALCHRRHGPGLRRERRHRRHGAGASASAISPVRASPASCSRWSAAGWPSCRRASR